MKKLSFLILMILISIFISESMTKSTVLPTMANKEIIEKNLLTGLTAKNSGLQRSCALMLGKIQSERSVIPLLRVLHNSVDEDVRIAAAWALCIIGDPRGTYSVKMATRFDESKRVRTVCAWYYENYVQAGNYMFSIKEFDIMTQVNESIKEYYSR